jgi:hypothetical protein
MELVAAALTDLKAAMTIDRLPSGIMCIMPEDYPLSSTKIWREPLPRPRWISRK